MFWEVPDILPASNPYSQLETFMKTISSRFLVQWVKLRSQVPNRGWTSGQACIAAPGTQFFAALQIDGPKAWNTMAQSRTSKPQSRWEGESKEHPSTIIHHMVKQGIDKDIIPKPTAQKNQNPLKKPLLGPQKCRPRASVQPSNSKRMKPGRTAWTQYLSFFLGSDPER